MATVLVLEDELSVLQIIDLILRTAGYSVLAAQSSEEAMRVCDQHKGPIELLIANILLGQETGAEAAARLRAKRPQMRVLFISGYPAEDLIARRMLDPSLFEPGTAFFLQKPFTPTALLMKLQEILVRHMSAH